MSTTTTAGWYPLEVTRVEHLTAEAVALSLHVPSELAGTFAHRPGQHVVVRHRSPAGELRRSYSVCPPPGDPAALRLVLKPVTPGGFGAYASSELAAGDLVELSPPAGMFGLAAVRGAHHVLIAGGCGITPLAPMAAAALRGDPDCRVSLVHSARTAADALLADEIALLKDEFVQRFDVLHVLTRERGGSELCTGRIDPRKLRRLLELLDVRPGAQFALCGPPGLLATAREALEGTPPEDVRTELFTSTATGPAPEPESLASRISATLGGRTSSVTMLPQDRVVLDAVLRHRPEVPYSCRDGVCGSCRAKVLSGEVALGQQHALDADDLAAGYTLACRARPRTDELALDFDA
ncbi:2Fe-2S iron-sulfur cluster binding domain-containing protein [Saccharopolyspora aridisoli]|uniref:2Fe-2S iron-sulfur cluster binding domain-containing protein n=1 Tax=Saccharopolyspora aridisoli TaxID=2530385 RepID=A0A4R4UME3_9PSEU|nr:2Fe-2S iron-sulfur cluster-binding protein [Saccharopolyspora aridisoli]TDC92870.1 2Fe-2S iron-sulfur cluster binding domain-containing protein [Saccharopolyspora aridisoli]